MPIAENSRVVPKSALRHRPVIPEYEEPLIPAWSTPTLRASRQIQAKQEAPAGSRSQTAPKKKRLPSLRRQQKEHLLRTVSLTILCMLCLTLIIQLAWNLGTSLYNNLLYGMPRTMQVDAFVGDETGKTPSHFIAENLHGRVVIIEIPGSDVQHVHVIVGPQIIGPNADQVPVVLSFTRSNGSRTADMIVRFGTMEVRYTSKDGIFVTK